MLVSIVRYIVGLCSRHAWAVIAVASIITAGSGYYAARHFAINTDINKLMASDIDWRLREKAYARDFPGSFGSVLVVVDAPTAELATEASASLAKQLSTRPDLFHVVRQLDGDPFFAKNGLLFQPESDLARMTQGLGRAAPVIGALAGDPSLRGLTRALSFGLLGVQQGQAKLDDLQRALIMSADTVDQVLAGRPASFSWRVLLTGAPRSTELRHFIEVQPVLDFSALQPGQAATDAIRKAASDLKLGTVYQARVRLTGPVAMADEEFGTLQDGAVVNVIGTIIIVLIILWLALHSPRIILAVFLNLAVGFAVTAALGLMMVGALNLISVAFAVLFVGLGVDFGIQFAVRYRSERFKSGDLYSALRSTAEKVGAPLTLAAAAIAAGFLSFFPTDYKGVSELGQIAGLGMLIAYVTTVTVLPALLTILHPPGEEEAIGYGVLAPVDRFLERHRIPVIAGTILVALGGLPLLYYLTFDFNPINLRSPAVESVATFLDLRTDPTLGANAINVLVPKSGNVNEVADRLRKVPEVDKVTTIAEFIPDGQDRKLALIGGLARQLQTPLSTENPTRPPTDAQNVVALQGSADALTKLASKASGPGADAANRLAASLTKLAAAGPDKRAAADAAFVVPLRSALTSLRNYLQAGPVTQQNLPSRLKDQWIAADGRTRVQALPKGDPNDNETLRRFARAIQVQFPEAVGTPISILESGKTIVRAFIHAGLFALVSIAILLWIVLRRFGDVLLTLVPLLLAGVVTLEVCVLIGMPLNFANIIALPLLLGVGVAFKIYYIMAWRGGQTNLLQSSLTRAVIWSALTTATAFGSLWLSSHPGTSSMGKLLALSLVTTMCAAVLFQPALMGKPRTAEENAGKSGRVEETAGEPEKAEEDAGRPRPVEQNAA
jgi:hopanoid biosynthesis associated RND transporter like protein HpnN